MRTQVEWNVPAQTSFAIDSSPRTFPRRSFISFAALFVKVIASIAHGGVDSCGQDSRRSHISSFVMSGSAAAFSSDATNSPVIPSGTVSS